MAPKQNLPERTKVRKTVVLRALNKLLEKTEQLDREASLEQQVYVPDYISPESFDNLHHSREGGVLLRFKRPTEFSTWHLDETQFLIIEGK